MSAWICPRCKTVWAYWVPKCDCKPAQIITAPTTAPFVYREYGCTCGQSLTVPCPVHPPKPQQVIC